VKKKKKESRHLKKNLLKIQFISKLFQVPFFSTPVTYHIPKEDDENTNN